jgi:hypothetical protein
MISIIVIIGGLIFAGFVYGLKNYVIKNKNGSKTKIKQDDDSILIQYV